MPLERRSKYITYLEKWVIIKQIKQEATEDEG